METKKQDVKFKRNLQARRIAAKRSTKLARSKKTYYKKLKGRPKLIISLASLIKRKREANTEEARLKWKSKGISRLANLKPTSKIVLVYRLDAPTRCDASRQIIRELKLRFNRTCRILPYSKELNAKLEMLNKHVIWGFLDKTTMERLVSTRGCIKAKHGVAPLRNNLVVERELGAKGILTVADLCDRLWKAELEDINLYKIVASFKVDKLLTSGLTCNIQQHGYCPKMNTLLQRII